MTRQKTSSSAHSPVSQETEDIVDENGKGVVAPGDLRKNKGLVYLRDVYIARFRQPYFQGLPESLVPVLLMRMLAGYTRQWHLSQAVSVVWLSLLLKYFTIDHKQFNLDLFRQLLGEGFSRWLSYLVLLAYLLVVLNFSARQDQLFYALAVYLLTDLGPRLAPKSITFSEAFTLATLAVTYASYGLARLLRPVVTSVGNPYLDVAIFGPWAALIGFSAAYFLLNTMLTPVLGKKPIVAYGISLSLTVGVMGAYCLQEVAMARILAVVTHPTNTKMIVYLAGTLVAGLLVLYDLSREPDRQLFQLGKVSNLTHRKLFHGLALLLYTPMHAMSMTDRKVFELLLLSQNWVTVLFIYVELARFACQGNAIGSLLNRAFMQFTDHRELSQKKLLLTHLYLLIGLGIPTNLTFIILNGGFPDGEMAMFAYSGVVFLGVGDTMAAFFGKIFGGATWRGNCHNKTQEGTLYSALLMNAYYYIFCAKVYAHLCSMFGIVAIATGIVALVEGFTSQFDNLVCPLLYFITLHQLYDYFIYIM